MNPIPQQLLISGTVLFLLGLLIGFAIPALRNPRMGMSVHVAGLQSGMAPSGSFSILAAMVLVLWGLCAWSE